MSYSISYSISYAIPYPISYPISYPKGCTFKLVASDLRMIRYDASGHVIILSMALVTGHTAATVTASLPI
jgi:hypothetical protein